MVGTGAALVVIGGAAAAEDPDHLGEKMNGTMFFGAVIRESRHRQYIVMVFGSVTFGGSAGYGLNQTNRCRQPRPPTTAANAADDAKTRGLDEMTACLVYRLLREAASARNGWRRILARCSPSRAPARCIVTSGGSRTISGAET